MVRCSIEFRQAGAGKTMLKPGYLGYVHSFRGFAILNVVAVHAFAFSMLLPADWKPNPTAPLMVLSETLFHDATVYFALISGLLFSSILRSRGYQSFYRSKAMYVLSPYIFCTIVFSLVRWNSTGTGVMAWPKDLSDYIGSILPNLLHGEAQFTYWYIPVLFALFAITPLLSALSLAKSYAAMPAWLIMLAPLVFSRPEFKDGVSQVGAGTLIYFCGAYMVGVTLGNRLESLLDQARAYRKPLLGTVAVTSVLLIVLQFNEINRFGGFSLQESVFYIQKLSIAALVLLWLRDRATNQPRWLTYFANDAFSIYFLHVFFILVLGEISWVFLHNSRFQPWSIYFAGPVFFAFALSMSMLVVRLMRGLLGRHSRVLIGS